MLSRMRWFWRKKPDPDKTWEQEIAPAARAQAQKRARLLVGQEALVSQVEALLFEADPIGINFEDNTDEYRPEAETIVLRLPEASSADDLRRIVHQEFVRWFDDRMAGPEDKFREISKQIWRAAHPVELPPGD